MSKLPSLELLEWRELVREMEPATPGGVEVRLFREFGGGVTCPDVDRFRGDDGEPEGDRCLYTEGS